MTESEIDAIDIDKLIGSLKRRSLALVVGRIVEKPDGTESVGGTLSGTWTETIALAAFVQREAMSAVM
jgi:hypothetical protein